MARLSYLGKRYRWFITYVAADLVRVTTLFFLRGGTSPRSWHAYSITWLWTEPVTLALLICSAFELVARVPEHYHGFDEAGHKKLRTLLQIAITVALISSVIEAHAYPWSFSAATRIPLMIAIKRMVTSALAGYLVLTALWLSYVRVPLQPNLLRHSFLFAGYLVLDTTVMLWENLAGGHGTSASNLVLALGSNMLFLLWTALLNKSGEAFPRHAVLSQAEINEVCERQQLLTEVLLRAAKRRE